MFNRKKINRTYAFSLGSQLISNLHTSIILGISSLSSKLGKIQSATISTKNDI